MQNKFFTKKMNIIHISNESIWINNTKYSEVDYPDLNTGDVYLEATSIEIEDVLNIVGNRKVYIDLDKTKVKDTVFNTYTHINFVFLKDHFEKDIFNLSLKFSFIEKKYFHIYIGGINNIGYNEMFNPEQLILLRENSTIMIENLFQLKEIKEKNLKYNYLLFNFDAFEMNYLPSLSTLSKPGNFKAFNDDYNYAHIQKDAPNNFIIYLISVDFQLIKCVVTDTTKWITNIPIKFFKGLYMFENCQITYTNEFFLNPTQQKYFKDNDVIKENNVFFNYSSQSSKVEKLVVTFSGMSPPGDIPYKCSLLSSVKGELNKTAFLSFSDVGCICGDYYTSGQVERSLEIINKYMLTHKIGEESVIFYGNSKGGSIASHYIKYFKNSIFFIDSCQLDVHEYFSGILNDKLFYFISDKINLYKSLSIGKNIFYTFGEEDYKSRKKVKLSGYMFKCGSHGSTITMNMKRIKLFLKSFENNNSTPHETNIEVLKNLNYSHLYVKSEGNYGIVQNKLKFCIYLEVIQLDSNVLFESILCQNIKFSNYYTQILYKGKDQKTKSLISLYNLKYPHIFKVVDSFTDSNSASIYITNEVLLNEDYLIRMEEQLLNCEDNNVIVLPKQRWKKGENLVKSIKGIESFNGICCNKFINEFSIVKYKGSKYIDLLEFNKIFKIHKKLYSNSELYTLYDWEPNNDKRES